jgi:hypothetical protein
MMHRVAEAIDHKSFYSLINSQSQSFAAAGLAAAKQEMTCNKTTLLQEK